MSELAYSKLGVYIRKHWYIFSIFMLININIVPYAHSTTFTRSVSFDLSKAAITSNINNDGQPYVSLWSALTPIIPFALRTGDRLIFDYNFLPGQTLTISDIKSPGGLTESVFMLFGSPINIGFGAQGTASFDVVSGATLSSTFSSYSNSSGPGFFHSTIYSRNASNGLTDTYLEISGGRFDFTAGRMSSYQASSDNVKMLVYGDPVSVNLSTIPVPPTVPIPPAFLLFGTGFIMLMGFVGRGRSMQH